MSHGFSKSVLEMMHALTLDAKLALNCSFLFWDSLGGDADHARWQ